MLRVVFSPSGVKRFECYWSSAPSGKLRGFFCQSPDLYLVDCSGLSESELFITGYPASDFFL